MGRPSNTRERRRQIVGGLLSVMAACGYEGASVAAIAAAAGLSPGLVHYHFTSKDEVLLALVDDLVARVAARYALLSARAAGPRARLDAFIDAHLALDTHDDARTAAAWTLVGAEALRHRAVQRRYRDALSATLTEMRSLVRACLRAEGLPIGGSRDIAAGLVACIEGGLRIASAAPGLLPAGFAGPTVRHLAAGLLAAEARPRDASGARTTRRR